MCSPIFLILFGRLCRWENLNIFVRSSHLHHHGPIHRLEKHSHFFPFEFLLFLFPFCVVSSGAGCVSFKWPMTIMFFSTSLHTCLLWLSIPTVCSLQLASIYFFCLLEAKQIESTKLIAVCNEFAKLWAECIWAFAYAKDCGCAVMATQINGSLSHISNISINARCFGGNIRFQFHKWKWISSASLPPLPISL